MVESALKVNNDLMEVSHLFLSTKLTAIRTSHSSSKLSQNPRKLLKPARHILFDDSDSWPDSRLETDQTLRNDRRLKITELNKWESMNITVSLIKNSPLQDIFFSRPFKACCKPFKWHLTVSQADLKGPYRPLQGLRGLRRKAFTKGL